MPLIEIDKITDVLNHIVGLSAVVFDLDDTLYSEKEYVRSGYKAVSKVLSLVTDAEEKLWRAFEAKLPAIDTVLRDEGVFSEELKERCLSVYRNHEPDIHLYLGVEDMLKEIRRRNIDIGIITDGRPEGQQKKIAALGLEPLVDEIIITDELGGPDFRKPNGRAFCLMRDLLGISGYDVMCYVGDNVSKDFVAPEEFGMRCIWFMNSDGVYFIEKKDEGKTCSSICKKSCR